VKLTKTTTIELSRDPEATDHRSGFHKLKDIIFDLREYYKDGDRIPYDDVEYVISKKCGIDDRTVRKYLKILEKLNYLKPIGKPKRKISRVTVQTKDSIHPKTYYSEKGYSDYIFGLFAPKHFRQEQIPSTTPLSEFNERSVNMEKMCVRVSRGHGGRTEQESEAGEQVRKIEERENTVAHTHILCHKHNINRKTSDNDFGLLTPEEMRILKSAQRGT